MGLDGGGGPAAAAKEEAPPPPARKAALGGPEPPLLEAFEGPGGGLDVLVRGPDQNVPQALSPLLSLRHRTVPFNELGRAVEVNTPLFAGTAHLLLRRLPNTPEGAFEGKRRKMWLTLQGRFKRPVPFDSLVVGSEFARPLQLPAGALLTRASCWLVTKMGGGVQLDPAGLQPHILAPLAAAAQAIHVAAPGSQPSPLDPQEDMRLHDAALTGWSGKPLTASKRRALFAGRTGRVGRCFDTTNVWTFHLYDQTMCYGTFTLPLPFFKIDLVQVLDGQPLLIMVKDLGSGLPAVHLEVWHRRMLAHPTAARAEPDAACSAAGAAASANGEAEADAEFAEEEGIGEEEEEEDSCFATRSSSSSSSQAEELNSQCSASSSVSSASRLMEPL